MPQTADLTGDTGVGFIPPQRLAIPGQPLELGPESMAIIADEVWIDEQYNAGAFDDYSGEYIAVVDKKLLGHNKIVQELREAVSRATGIRMGRIVTDFIDRNLYL